MTTLIRLLLTGALTFAGSWPAAAQSGDPGKAAPGGRSDSAPAAPGGAPGGSDKGAARGVITPPADVDPGISRTPPQVDFPTPVIRPPVPQGGDPKVPPR